jgi:uncharacterized phage-associated protein
MNIQDIANFFLVFSGRSGEAITNLKLQKLAYYAQAWHLANFGTELFPEDFQAWVHGPVNVELYHQYKERGYQSIVVDIDTEKSFERVKDKIDFLNAVAEVYMPFGGYYLEKMTHQEDPWIIARNGALADERSDTIITKESMKDFYAKKIQDKSNNPA